MKSFWSLGIAISLAVSGQLLLKSGIDKVGPLTISSLISTETLREMLFSTVSVGVLVYMFSAVFYMIALSGQEVSRLYPLFSLTYIGVVVGAFLFLGERFEMVRVIGVLLVIAGCYIILRS